MIRGSGAALLAALLVAGCSSGGGRDGTTRGDIVPGGWTPDIIGVPVLAVETAVSAPLALVNLTAGWERTEEQTPLPWIAPEKRVEAYRKGKLPTAFDLDTEKYRWRVGDTMVYPFYEYNDRISEFVLGNPISKDWEYSGESTSRKNWFFAKPMLMPDYDFYLVSIQPMAVIMVPTGVHRHARHAPYTRDKLTDRAILPIASIKYATRFRAPPGQILMWFSPDLDSGIQPLSFDPNGLLAFEGHAFRMNCKRSGADAECWRMTSTH